ncbi:MAG: hypothetical protein ACHQIM_10895 [Sphingobacteriales bacterium]
MKKLTATPLLSKIQPDIEFVPGALKPGTPAAYYALLLGIYTQVQSPGYPAPDTENITGATLPLAAPATLPAFTPAIQQRADCLLQTISNKYPMLLGEYADSETLTILDKDWEAIPAGTVVFERVTNLATLYYVVSNIRLDAGGKLNVMQPELVMSRQPVLHENVVMVLKGKKQSLPMKIAKSIGGAMLSKIGGFVGDLIVHYFFPEGVPDYFDEVYKEITRIVDQKIDANTILTINGALHNVMDKLDSEYIPAKEGANPDIKADREKLFSLLQKYDTVFLTGPGGMLGALQDAKLAHAGFGAFMLGAALQIGLSQEMAFVDPGNYDDKLKKWKSPLESSYGKPVTGTVAKTAKKYAAYATQTWADIIEKRKGQVKAVKFHKQVVIGWDARIGNHYKTVYMANLTDMGVPTAIEAEIGQDEKDGKNNNFDVFGKNNLPGYRTQKVTELIEEMADPMATINDWLKLIDHPVTLS